LNPKLPNTFHFHLLPLKIRAGSSSMGFYGLFNVAMLQDLIREEREAE
jgi:hypothetical protein